MAPGHDNLSAFVLWDFGTRALRPMLQSVVAHQGAGFSISMPGLGEQAGERLRDIVLPGLVQADVVLVATDHANVNVGFETGIAAGLGKELLFFQQTPWPPASGATHWLHLGPLTDTITHHVEDAAALVALLAERDKRIRWERFRPNNSSRRGLFLCPAEHEGAECRAACANPHAVWTRIDRERFSHQDLSSICKDVSSIVWTLTQHRDGADQGHGAENVANAVLAGWFFAGMLLQELDLADETLIRDNWDLACESLKVLRSTSTPSFVDLSTLERTFHGREAYERHLQVAYEAIQREHVARATPRAQLALKWTETPDYADSQQRRLGEDLDQAYVDLNLTSRLLEEARAAGDDVAPLEHTTSDLKSEIQRLQRMMRESGGLKPGQRLGEGRYRLTRPLGHGGLASVWLASDRQEQRDVAIKVMHEHLGRDLIRREYFYRGASTMARLHHDAIVQVLAEPRQESGYHYFVVECVAGLTFQEAVLYQGLSQHEVVEIIRRVAAALCLAHDRGWCHRDVKPTNILLNRAGEPKLTDFDLVSASDSSWATRTSAVGSALYTCPDVLSSKRRPVAADDVYSLGLSLLFGLKGEREDWYTLIAERDQTVNALECQDELKTILLKATHRDWSRRYQHARDFEEELDAYLQLVQPGSLSGLAHEQSPLSQFEAAVTSAEVAPSSSEPLGTVDAAAEVAPSSHELLGTLDEAAEVAPSSHEPLGTLDEAAEVAPSSHEPLGTLDEAAEVAPSSHEPLGTVDEAAEVAPSSHEPLGTVDAAAEVAPSSSEPLGTVDAASEGSESGLDLHEGDHPEALDELADLYERQCKWVELTDVLERQFDAAATDEDRGAILTRQARLFSEQLGRDDEALAIWHRLLDVDPSNLQALRAIADIWRTRRESQELVCALHATIERAFALLKPDELRELYRELARTYGDVLNAPYDAADAWRGLLEVDPADFEAMDRLETAYRADQSWLDVVQVKVQRSQALPGTDEKIRELLEAAGIWRELDEYDRATPIYEKILAIDPSHPVAFEQLEKLHGEATRWDQLIELYLNRSETRELASERPDLLRRIARICDERLDDKGQAFDALLNAFAEDYGDDDTVSYLERMAQATERWGELINTANSWLQEQTDDRQKILLCLRLGKWYGEDLEHPGYAKPYYAMIAELDPNNVEVRRRVAAIHRMNANWQQMGEELTRALDVAVAPDDRKAILHELGELLERHLDQSESGIAFYKRALEVDPLYLPTLEALERIYEERGHHAELVAVLGSKVKALGDPGAVAVHKLRLGSLFETSLGDSEKAVQAYQEVLDIDPSNLPALKGLERVHGSLKRWPDLASVLEQQVDLVETEREKVEVLLQLAGVQEEQFLKPDVAAVRLEQALAIDPGEVRAYEAVERCYRRLKQWPDLLRAYERHIEESLDIQGKLQKHFAIAQICTEEVGDVDRAIDAYRNIVSLDDTNIPAFEALARLYEKQGDARNAIDAMARMADLATDAGQRAETLYWIGRALEEKLGDRTQAKERFEAALDLAPAHLPSLAALRDIAIDEADWDRAARYLDQEQLHTPVPRNRARLLVELGRLRDEMLKEHDQAIVAYELAIQCDDDCEDAALPLVLEYARVGRWEEAEPLAELLVRKAKNRDRHEQHRLHRLQGSVLAALGKFDRSLKAYQAAHRLDLSDQETIRGIADTAFELKEWPTSLTNYQKVLTALGGGDSEQQTDIYCRLGCIKREQGQARQAISNYEKALGVDPGHRRALDALVDLCSKLNNWKQVVAYKRQILDGLFDEDARYVVLNEIGEVWTEKDNNPAKAIEAYEEALDLRPEDHVLLHKLLQLYQRKGDWGKMVETVQAIAQLEDRPEVKARYLFTIAQLCRDKLRDPERAVELFDEALDLNPSYLEAFERIEKILTGQKDWKQLENAYRKMIYRIAGEGNSDLENTLWHQLGLLYRDRLELIPESIEAFQRASAVKPEMIAEHQILADLYETTERLDEGIREQRIILESDPTQIEPYRATYRLLLHKQSHDQAWCLAAAMAFAGQAGEEELRFFEESKPQGIVPGRGGLTNDHWIKHLIHSREDTLVSKIMEMIAPAALHAKIAQLRMQGRLPTLDPRFRQDPNTSTVTFARTFGQAAQVLGIAPPELHVRSDAPKTIACVPSIPPASIAGQPVVTGFEPQESMFIAGRHLTNYRGEYFIRTLFPTQAELTIMLLAGVMVAFPSTPMPADTMQQIQTTARELAKYIEPVQLEGLRHFARRFLDEGAKANIKVWNQSVDLTAARAGLLLCGDLETARKIISAEPQAPGDLSADQKMRELVLFSVSDDYTALRRALGVTLSAEQAE